MEAAGESRIGDMQRLLTAGANVNAVDSDGDTALAYAVGHFNHEATALLLEAGADVCALATYGEIHAVNPKDHPKAQLALFKACKYNSIACAAAAIAAGADINYALKPTITTPLIEAVSYGASSALVKYLVSMGADVFARDEDGWNAFMWFAKECDGGRSEKDLETMAALLEPMGPRAKQWVITNTYDGGLFPNQAAEIIQDAWRDYAAKKKADAAKKIAMVKGKAVSRIQSAWKGYMYEKGVQARCAPLVRAWINKAATTIQKAWRKYAESREYAEKKKIDAWLHAVSVSRVYKDSAKYYLQDHVFSDYVLDNTFLI
jgi:ankyrin repeat protein